MFRYEAPQAGRYREHWQFGAEAIGSDDPLLDAEVIALLDGIYRRLGRARACGCAWAAWATPESRGPYRERAGRVPRGPPGDARRGRAASACALNPLRLFDTKDPRVAEVMAGRPEAARPPLAGGPGPPRAGAAPRSTRLGIAYEEDPTLVRGFDYYTMTVFEFTSDHLGAQSAVGGRRALRRPGGAARRTAHARASASAPGIERIVLALEASGPDPRAAGRRRATWRCSTTTCACELLPLLEELRGRRAALRERPARAQPEGHDAPRRRGSGPARGDRGPARARGRGGHGARHGHAATSAQVPLADLVEALSAMIGCARATGPTPASAPPTAVGRARARRRLGAPPPRPRRGGLHRPARPLGAAAAGLPPGGRARGPHAAAGALSPEDVICGRGRGGRPRSRRRSTRPSPPGARRAARWRTWRCSPRPTRCPSRWRTRARRPPRSCG